MSLRDQTPEASLETFFDTFRRSLHTAYPGSIVSYDPDTKTCSVKIHYSDFYQAEGAEPIREDWPPLEDVPVLFPRGGGWAITFPLAADDPVLVVFCERSLDEWAASDGKSDLSPTLPVTHDASDCIVIAGLFPTKAAEGLAHAENLIISHGDGNLEMHLTPDGEMQVKAGKVRFGTLAADKALALAEKCDARLDALESFANAHTHICVNIGAPCLPGVPTVTPGSTTASDTVYTDD